MICSSCGRSCECPKAEEKEPWKEFSNLLFNPDNGWLAKLYPTIEEREQFARSEECKAIRKIIDEMKIKFLLKDLNK